MSRKDTQESDRQAHSSADIYCFMDIVAREAEGYAADHTTPMSALLEEIEHNPHHAEIAQEFFKRSPCGFKIRLRMGEALEILKTLPDATTDLVFIDADKQNYSG
jgi:predicted O-methyltransferase YrrM